MKKKKDNVFWIFGILKAIILGLIIFFIFQGLSVIGKDTQITLSVLFALFSLIMDYMIYSKK